LGVKPAVGGVVVINTPGLASSSLVLGKS